MQILVRTDNHIEGSAGLTRHVEDVVTHAMSRFEPQLTRVEVHLTDENGAQKAGDRDHRCIMEARLAGLQPIAVSHHAASINESLSGAAGKIEKAIEHAIDRISHKKGRPSYSGER